MIFPLNIILSNDVCNFSSKKNLAGKKILKTRIIQGRASLPKKYIVKTEFYLHILTKSSLNTYKNTNGCSFQNWASGPSEKVELP